MIQTPSEPSVSHIIGRHVLSFTANGKPQPKGSKRTVPVFDPVTKAPRKTATGGIMTRALDDNPNAGEWMDRVANAARDAAHAVGLSLLEGPLVLVCTFFQPRPKSHYRTGKNAHLLRDTAPAFPDGKPDTTKLIRAIEDAINEVIWRDDTQVVNQNTGKLYGVPARAECHLYVLPATLAEVATWVNPGSDQ